MGTDSTPAGPPDPADPGTALADRLFHDMVGALELFTVYLGNRLGLYRALATDGPATSAELAARTGTAERYAREWLEHHAASGLLEVDDPAAGPLDRRYRLPPAYVPILADPDDVRYQAFKGVEAVRAGRWRSSWRRTKRGTRRPRCPGHPRAGQTTTAPCTSTCWAGNGCPRSRTWTSGCTASHPPGSPTWRAVRAGRASRWPRPTR